MEYFHLFRKLVPLKDWTNSLTTESLKHSNFVFVKFLIRSYQNDFKIVSETILYLNSKFLTVKKDLTRSLSPSPTLTNKEHSFIQVYSSKSKIFFKSVWPHLTNTGVTLPSRIINF